MNSFRHVQNALEFEVRRQRDLLLDGEQIIQETLLWNPDKNCSESMRGKEDAHDYRYFPCPDLVPVEISDEWIERIRDSLPELPDDRRRRIIRQYNIPDYDSVLLTADRAVADYFEQVVEQGAPAKKASNWIMTELMRELKGEDITSCPVSAKQLASLLQMIEKNTISGKIAKSVFLDMMASGKNPEEIVRDKNLVQVSDEGELLDLVREIIEAHPDQVEEFRNGKTKLMGFFVGQLMQKTKGKANPKLANSLFRQELSG